MASYAQLDSQNKIIRVLKIDNELITNEDGSENEQLGETLCRQFTGENSRFIKTSATASIRRIFASVDGYYIEQYDEFAPPKPYNSWVYDHETGSWVPPIPVPDHVDDHIHLWNEDITNWFLCPAKLPPEPNPEILSPEN